MVAEIPLRSFGENPGLEPAAPAALDPLVAACQAGEPSALTQLFENNKDRVYSIALRFSGDPASALDISQDVFLKLLAQLPKFRGEAKFETWLYRLVVNACLDHNRRQRRWLPLVDNFLGKFRADSSAEAAELRDHVARAIGRLPADQRIAVVLRYTEGLSYEQIAEATGVPTGTVASRLNRAHATLAALLAGWKGAL